ncbi:MAG: hypothetical protein PHG63_00985 [Candidatus Dojkabacteria bacterium]|nr:hypothetical protein [Candidatus Dojkabacteria bacterium]
METFVRRFLPGLLIIGAIILLGLTFWAYLPDSQGKFRDLWVKFSDSGLVLLILGTSGVFVGYKVWRKKHSVQVTYSIFVELVRHVWRSIYLTEEMLLRESAGKVTESERSMVLGNVMKENAEGDADFSTLEGLGLDITELMELSNRFKELFMSELPRIRSGEKKFSDSLDQRVRLKTEVKDCIKQMFSHLEESNKE